MDAEEAEPGVGIHPNLPLLCLLGPTAAGKTGVALRLCDALPLEIISVDSSQVYRHMNIGTAKAEAATLARYPHHLVNIREPSQTYSAAEFRQDALRLIRQIAARGHWPLLVGGTMLYFRALLSGLSVLPGQDPVVRQQLASRAAVTGWSVLHSELSRLDPEAAAMIQPADGQRIQRALEVITLTGQKLSDLQAANRRPSLPNPVLQLCVLPGERARLHARIAHRFSGMLEQGLVAEVQALQNSGILHESMPALRILGYRQIWQHLQGRYSLQEAQHRAVVATRQLAKRQLTWLRHSAGITWWLNPQDDFSALLVFINSWLQERRM